ncbi:chromosome segregation protein SMC [Candidatus Woesearchaeota archaeon]|nr:chromosome segregation protein SMC [Candidatus Woesearchaeota archaeon]
MTKINRITIQGFKSFAHKTDILFDTKFNCIEKSANLIFNGGKNKTPSPHGTVEIAFDNSSKIFPIQDPEVVVSRTITKEGISIYRINGKKKTRTEIIDLLGAARINPEGYNIVLQGDITHFVDMSSVERRQIIEQISDVSVYEEKKHKALLELQKVDEKLGNADIILKERKTYLKELKSDRDQALQFKELKDKVDSYKATNLRLQMKEKQEIKDKLDQEIGGHQTKITAAEKKIEELKVKINEHKEKVSQINKEIEQRGEQEQVKVHREVEDLKVALAKEKTRISTLKDEINKIKQRKDQFQLEMKELHEKGSSFGQESKGIQQKTAQKKKELDQLEQSIAQFKKKNNIETSQDLEKELEQKDSLIEKKQEEAQVIRQKQQELLREKDKLEYQLQTLADRIKKVKEVEQDNKEQIKQLQQYKEDFKKSTLKLNQLLDQDSSFASQLSNARKNISEMQEEEAKLNAKMLSLKAGISANTALRSILDNKKKFKGVHGTIAELGQANKKYSMALERAAGNRMQEIVVDDDGVAADCIQFLKTNKLGAASFIPLNKIRAPDVGNEDQKLLKQQGVHDFAINLISFKSQYKKAFSYVFGTTLVVDDIGVARKVGIGRIKMVSLDGNIAEASGVMKGGFFAQRAGLGFQEKDSQEAVEKIENEIQELQNVLSTVQMRREANEKEISSLRTRKGELEGEMIKLEKTLHLETGDLDASAELKKEIETQLKEVNTNLNNIQRDISIFNKDLAELKSRKQILRSQVSELRDPRLQAQLSAFEASRQQCREEIVRLEGELKNTSTQIEKMIAPEQEKIKEIIKQHDKEETQFNIEIKSLSESINKKEAELTQKEKASKEFYSKYHALFNEREKLSTDITKADNEIESHREQTRSHEREVNLISLKNAEIKAKLAGMGEEFNKYQNAEILTNKKPEELQHEINKFEVMLAQMSAVNMKALEIYEQVETEFNKLIEKKDGLDKEKTDVLTFMNEIETKKTEHFMKTFTQVNDNFQRIFLNLFKKGKAHLQLEKPNNPFDDGLTVKVKIRGNSYLDLRSLSGGEKTLTALSFIFAIQEYQPASFYILDEIDAALDKQNALTLAKLIRDYSTRAQYIMISHNDSVISEADTLFGVSMNDGVSKITSLRI